MMAELLQKGYYTIFSLLMQNYTNIFAYFYLFSLPPSSYSFAIVGINITDLAYSLLVSGALKTHLYNVAPEMPSLLHFQQTFCEFSQMEYIQNNLSAI